MADRLVCVILIRGKTSLTHSDGCEEKQHHVRVDNSLTVWALSDSMGNKRQEHVRRKEGRNTKQQALKLDVWQTHLISGAWTTVSGRTHSEPETDDRVRSLSDTTCGKEACHNRTTMAVA